jgi:hypothetical protein
MGAIETIAATQFLGQEFATWLYWLSETNGGKIKLDGIEEFEAWFESPVQLVADYGEATSVVLAGGTPMESPEARQALRENKMLDRTRLRVIWRNQTFSCSFNASTFSISGLKLPVPPNAPAADHIFLRLEIFEQFEFFFESIFAAFLKLRLSEKQWAPARRKMSEWVKAFELA